MLIIYIFRVVDVESWVYHMGIRIVYMLPMDVCLYMSIVLSCEIDDVCRVMHKASIIQSPWLYHTAENRQPSKACDWLNPEACS